jgi:lipooligosaccharide transport system permease protein
MAYALRAYEYWMTSYRRTWHASLVSSFLNPVLYLTALGVGLGKLVNRGGGGLGIPYLDFVAPGMLAVVSMQIGTFESSWPIMAAIRWTRTFHAMVATPLRVRDVVLGHQFYVATRVGLAAAIYLAALSVFGAIHSLYGLLAWPAAILLGVSFSAPIMALAGWFERDEGFNVLFRFGITPLFLFSGTFFPISRLPPGVRELAYTTPLWHGVDLMRHLTLGTPALWPSLGHVAYMALWFGAGVWLAQRTLTPRLVS